MAEFVLTTVVETLTNLIVEEAVFLKRVSEKVERLRDDFQWMQSFLKDADAEQHKNERFRNWVSQIREVALDAQDVIETYISKASQSSWNLAAKSINLHKVGKQIDKIQSRVQNISTQKQHFGITSSREEGSAGMIASANERLRWWRHPSPDIQKDDGLVDLVEDTQALTTQLSCMESRRRVVSIVGMGGLGKTTLAKKVYNHVDIKNQFDCKAFVYVSKEYNRRDTVQKIIAAVGSLDINDLKKVEEEALLLKLHELLEQSRYLVVLDDIWETEVWDSLEDVFPSGKMGSKVMLTTRKNEVALHADAMSKPLEPRFLTQDQSMELLLKKALLEKDHLASDLEKIGKEMVDKCGGLPLAIVVLGGLLSSKMKTVDEWQRVLQNITSRLVGGSRVSAILDLSYNDLSFDLKSCFLHVGVFPEGHSIHKRKLMELWIADGFLPQPQGEETVEDVAESCLNKLIDRCMIQVGERTSFGGRVKTIRIHDLLRDLSVLKGKEESFLEICSGEKVEPSSVNQSTKSRRLAIHSHCDKYAFLKPYAPYLRSLQVFNEKPENIDICFKHFKLLRVLDGVMPATAIGNLNQLRYLELVMDWTQIDIPQSIGNLKYLQTLKLSSYNIKTPIPNVIWKMKNLKHLYLFYAGENLRLDTLSQLQRLKYIQAGRWIEDGGLGNMISLQRLWIFDLPTENVKLVISIIAERLHHLQSLSLALFHNESYPTLMRLCDCVHLHKLALLGKITKLPDAHEFPPNLVKLCLFFSNLGQDSIDKLQRFPKLKMLLLGVKSIKETKLVCSSEGFPQLQILQLQDQHGLRELVVEEGAMIELKSLKIIRCGRLEKIPERLKLMISHFGTRN